MPESLHGGAAAALASPSTNENHVPVSQRRRIAGLLLVLAVAFLSSVLSSISRVGGNSYTTPDALLGFRYFETLLHQLVSLALLAYVVKQNRQGWGALGLGYRAQDLVHGIILWGITSWSYRLLMPYILTLCEWLGWHHVAPYLPGAKLGLSLLTLCFVIVNPVFEEMIVRAFLMSETITLTGSTTLAILFSVALQTSYHLYQGVPYAIALGLIFLIFSIYYARTHRILPVIVAHLLADFFFHLRYIIRAHSGH